jgi:hypothetical protein
VAWFLESRREHEIIDGGILNMRFLAIVVILFLPFLILPSLQATEQDPELNIEVKFQKWTGDLDGMIKRRYIRTLVVYNKTNYSVDKGTQHGIAYDAMKAFETELNKKMKLGENGVHVIFLPNWAQYSRRHQIYAFHGQRVLQRRTDG